MAAPALLVDDLSVEFRTRGGVVKALDRVGFHVAKGETVAVVGESGSGKSVTAYAVMGILDPAARITSGRAVLGALDLLSADKEAMARVRGREIAMIFQNPRTALNPIRRVGDQIADVLLRHANVTTQAAPREAIRLLETVGITDPTRRARAYPFELSGGMCQRVMIAIALAANPSLLIADEPTTGLDVTTQAIIMDIIAERAAATGMATIFITHDLGLAAERADRIVVMHAGHIVEAQPTRALFSQPRHPYTAALIAATPGASSQLADLTTIGGGLPDLRAPDLPACRYAGRCQRRLSGCSEPLPPINAMGAEALACHNPLPVERAA
jgi:peptide/nickel transport system ATP-binding protein